MSKSVKQYWYRMYSGECPVCGRDASYKERVYGNKPAEHEKRYIPLTQTATYDFCLEREAM